MSDLEKSEKPLRAFALLFHSEVIWSGEAGNGKGLLKISNSFGLLNQMH